MIMSFKYLNNDMLFSNLMIFRIENKYKRSCLTVCSGLGKFEDRHHSQTLLCLYERNQLTFLNKNYLKLS